MNRYGGYGADIVGDIVSDRSVTSGKGPYQPPFRVGEADGSSVKLELAAVVEAAAGAFTRPAVEVLKFLDIVGVAQ